MKLAHILTKSTRLSGSDFGGSKPVANWLLGVACYNTARALRPKNLDMLRLDGRSLIVLLGLVIAVIFNLYHLYPEVAIQAPMLNDGVLHLEAMKQMAAALAAGQNPTDVWLGTINLGYPLFHHYQHLAYLPPAMLHHLTGLSLPNLFHWTRYLLLSLFPLSIYWSMRRFDFDRLPAAMAGLVASLIATNNLFGFDFASYIWRGGGLYTQLWGMFLLPPTLAQGYTTLRTGRGYIWATLLLAATLLAHLVFGYIAVISLGVLVLVTSYPRTERGELFWQRFIRLALLLGLVGLVTAYFALPFWLDKAYMNRSVWEEATKYDSYGHSWVLNALFTGDLFDFGRWPSLTLLAGLGLGVCLWHWRQERYRIPMALSLFWLLLYFGRPTWGYLLNLLPLSGDLHLHRLLAGVHLGGIYLIGLGLALPWQWAWARQNKTYLLAPAILTGLLLYPVYTERTTYLAENGRWLAASQDAFTVETEDIASFQDTLQALPPGRVYAGLSNNWGQDYTIGDVPMYGLLNRAGLDMVGYLYHALSLNADIQILFDESRVEQYNLFNIRYMVAPVDWPMTEFFQPVQDFGRHRLYQVATTGYFDLIQSDLAFSGSKQDFYAAASSWLNSDLPQQKQHPILYLNDPIPIDVQALPLSQADQIMAQKSFPDPFVSGHIVSENVETNEYQAQVALENDSMVMLKVTYHPNWQATIDGVGVDTMMVMPSFIGIKVPAGTHQIRLVYQPRPLRSILLILGLLTLPLIAITEHQLHLVGGLPWSKFDAITRNTMGVVA